MLYNRRLIALCCVWSLGSLAPTMALAQEGSAARPSASQEAVKPVATDRRADAAWRTAALCLGGVAAIGFMHGRRRYD